MATAIVLVAFCLIAVAAGEMVRAHLRKLLAPPARHRLGEGSVETAGSVPVR